MFLYKCKSFLINKNNFHNLTDINSNRDNENPWDFSFGNKNNSDICVLNSWYITGISDGEGSFQITIQNNKGKGKTGYKPFLEFKITQKEHSTGILYEIKKYFKCGRINIDNRKTKTMKFVVTNNDDLLKKIIPHFEKFPLKTSKYLNYLDFKNAVLLISNKEHYEKKGIIKLKEIKSSMNKSRLFEDKYNYCWNNCILKLEPEWVEGFIDGEGSFQCEINTINNKNIKDNSNIYNTISFSLQIKQSNHDVAILYAIKNFFSSGYLKPKYDIKNLEATKNAVRNTTALWIRNSEVISKFIDLYPLYTIKRLDYFDWKRLIMLKKEKRHLTKEGFTLMKNIKNTMNNNRNK